MDTSTWGQSAPALEPRAGLANGNLNPAALGCVLRNIRPGLRKARSGVPVDLVGETAAEKLLPVPTQPTLRHARLRCALSTLCYAL